VNACRQRIGISYCALDSKLTTTDDFKLLKFLNLDSGHTQSW
jgi:hypothetical protein